jgi:hypothetical protein
MPLPMPRLAPVTTPRQQDMSRNGKKWMFGDKNDDIMGIHMVTFMVICMYVYIHTIYIYYFYRDTYMHIYIYIHIHMYVYIYTCTVWYAYNVDLLGCTTRNIIFEIVRT